MAKDTCSHCGARFGIKGSVGTLDDHVTAFHPDGSVAVRVSAPEPEASEPTGLEALNALRTRAKELGLPATGSKAALEAAIDAEEDRLAGPKTTHGFGGSETRP
jgi:hypothetical protein